MASCTTTPSLTAGVIGQSSRATPPVPERSCDPQSIAAPPADIPRDPATARSYPVILTNMKTAISVPDDTFERASRRAHDLGMSRSEFFTRAAARYLDELEAESLTEQIDTAIASLEATDDSAADAVAVGRRLLIEATDEW
jgi:hypothetical protein